MPGNLIEPDFPRQLVEQAHAAPGGLSGVVFAAGVVAFGEIATLDDDVLDELMLVNLLAPIRLIRAAAAVLPAGGFLAMISAVVAEMPTKSMAAYSAAKAGLTAFDKAAAAELRRRQIRVLDIRPTHTETGLAGRPIAGSSPALPTGNDPAAGRETGCPGDRRGRERSSGQRLCVNGRSPLVRSNRIGMTQTLDRRTQWVNTGSHTCASQVTGSRPASRKDDMTRESAGSNSGG